MFSDLESSLAANCAESRLTARPKNRHSGTRRGRFPTAAPLPYDPGWGRAVATIFKRKAKTMLYSCTYTWNPAVTIEEVGRSILEQHDAGTLRPEWIRG